MPINLKTILEWNWKGVLVEKIQEFGLLPKSGDLKCPKSCNGYLKLVKDKNSIDGYRFQCDGFFVKSKRKRFRCRFMQRLRKNSFFSGSHLELWKVLAFVHLWLEKVPLRTIALECEISQHSAVDWSSFCREVVYDGIVKNVEKIGGPGKVVEIDESKFGKRKFHRGHYVEGAWVFGGIERESGKIFMEVVESRDAPTLVALVKKWILPGTTIHADCWRGYIPLLNDPDFKLLQVNHSLYFKDPDTGVHTNSIEGSWRHAKSSAPSSGRKKHFLGGYLARYMFLKKASFMNVSGFSLFCSFASTIYFPDLERRVESDNSDSDLDV